jgi:acyl-CoA synthetase (NDP forming)
LPAKLPTLRVRKAVVSKLLATVQREWLPAATTEAILQAYGIAFAHSRRVSNPGDAVAAAHGLGYPVVLKTQAGGTLDDR